MSRKAAAAALIAGGLVAYVALRPTGPRGRGMFIGAIAQVGTPAQFAARIRREGLSWVAIAGPWQDNTWIDFNAGDISAYLAAARKAGAQIWVAGWPDPSAHAAFVDGMVRRAIAWKAKGLIIDPEKPYYDKPAAAMDLMARLRKAYRGPIGCTSYGAPWHHKRFPWAVFAQCDFGMPQVYDKASSEPENYPSKSVKEWRALGFGRHIVPLLPFFLTAEHTRSLAVRLPRDRQGVGGWLWRQADESEWAAFRLARA